MAHASRIAWVRRFSFLAIAFTCFFVAEPAYAYSNLSCQGPVPVGNLYDTAAMCQGVNNLSNIFSGLVCDFQSIVDIVMSRVYCGIQFALKTPLTIGLVIFFIIFGIQIFLGMVQVSTRELVMRLLKITLIWVFATESTVGIGIMYNFFIDAANQGVGWMLAAIPMPAVPPTNGFCTMAPILPGMTSDRIAFQYMDYLICSTITGPFTAQGAALAGFFGVLAYAIPPVFMMFLYFIFKSLSIFMQCLLSYLLGISVIAFMITLSPLFLSFALFKPTYRFFDDWLRILISFTLQIILVFAGAALWVMVISKLGGFFDNLSTMLRVVEGENKMGQMGVTHNAWGVCEHRVVQTMWGPLIQCVDQWVRNSPTSGLPLYFPEPIKPAKLVEKQEFLYFTVVNLLAICVVAYVFDALMKMLPTLAKELAGPSSAPQLASGPALGVTGEGGIMNMGKMLTPENAGSKAKDVAEAISGMFTKR